MSVAGTSVAQNLNININVDGDSMNASMSGSDSTMNVDMNVSGSDTQTSSSSSSSTTVTTTTSTSSSGTVTKTDTTENINVVIDDTDTHSTSTAAVECFTSETEMNGIISAIQAEGFDDDKLNVTQQAIKTRCLTVVQIRKLMDEFDFEEDKLTVAKYAYDSCSDTENYFMLSQAFDFSDSKQALNRFIDTK